MMNILWCGKWVWSLLLWYKWRVQYSYYYRTMCGAFSVIFSSVKHV